MKKLIVLVLTLSGVIVSFNANAVNTRPEVNDEAALQFTVKDVLSMKAKDFAKMTGERNTLKNRIVFGMVKGKLKKEVKKGNLALSASPAMVVSESGSSFNWVAFLLCVFLSILGFLIVLLFFDKSALTSALIGLGVSLILYGALFI